MENHQTVYFFTHIPKTAGTSVRKHLLYPNIPEHHIGHTHGLKELLRRRWEGCRWLEGHHPYGIHRFMRGLQGRPVYFTMLRDPLERAISFYYFLRAAKDHPQHVDAIENEIKAFYAKSKYQNIQTRFIAGFLWHRARNFVSAKLLDSYVLRVAKKHLLEKYRCFGLAERHDESLLMFAESFGWSCQLPEKRVKQTSNRPSQSELSSNQKAHIRWANRLDFELYRFAREHFEAQRAYQRTLA